MNTHFGYYDTQYGRYEEVLKPRLLELGVKHIRDGTYNDDVVRKYKEVGEAGVRLLLITQADKAAVQAKAIGPMLWGVEAVNEPDGGRAPGTWEQAARREQQRLYEAMKADAALRSVPVVGISLANIKRVLVNWAIYRNGWITEACTLMQPASIPATIGAGVCRWPMPLRQPVK